MRLGNTVQTYGLVSWLLHWLMAFLIIGLFALGLYMVSLDYTNPWSTTAVFYHLGLGVVTALLLVVRFGWRLKNVRPEISGKEWEQRVALWVHRLFYILIAVIVLSGYLITTADGKVLSVFGWFNIPATIHGHPNQEDIAGLVHEISSYICIVLVVIHSLAAIKHYLFDN